MSVTVPRHSRLHTIITPKWCKHIAFMDHTPWPKMGIHKLLNRFDNRFMFLMMED